MRKNFSFYIFLILFQITYFNLTAMEDGAKAEQFDPKYNPDKAVNQLADGINAIDLNSDDEYYSDSEDEEGYEYNGYDLSNIVPDQEEIENKSNKYFIFFRGIHFSPSIFSKKQISQMRRNTGAGESILSSAAFDVAHVQDYVNPVVENNILEDAAQSVKNVITSLSVQNRNTFQQLYTNRYDKFHEQLKKKSKTDYNGIFRKFKSSRNPQVSTAEFLLHAEKYAFGQKFLGSNTKILDPEYDQNGKPRHPYLGKIYIILVNINDIENLDPYFVVYAHANNLIKVYTHYSNDILAEREVSFPSFIPGKYVVFEKAVRVPNFIGEYKNYYLKKYGVTRRKFENTKQKLSASKEQRDKAIKNRIKTIIEFEASKLERAVIEKLKKNNIKIVYKGLDGNLAETLSSMTTAKAMNTILSQGI
ncbi:MAG: hypothetical protein WC436_03500 [Candidatus Babeliales bacterium]